ncbi:hypothetical protein ACFL1H_07545 [Nanoarchaeota archaeon]
MNWKIFNLVLGILLILFVIGCGSNPMNKCISCCENAKAEAIEYFGDKLSQQEISLGCISTCKSAQNEGQIIEAVEILCNRADYIKDMNANLDKIDPKLLIPDSCYTTGGFDCQKNDIEVNIGEIKIPVENDMGYDIELIESHPLDSSQCRDFSVENIVVADGEEFIITATNCEEVVKGKQLKILADTTIIKINGLEHIFTLDATVTIK